MNSSKELANKELKILRHLADKKFIGLLGVLFFIFATIIGNIAVFGINVIKTFIVNPNTLTEFKITIKDIFIPNIKEGELIYLIVYFLAMCVYIKMVLEIRASFKDISDIQKGSSRFATPEEIKRDYKEIDDKDTEFDGWGGLPVARIGNKLYIDDSVVNNFILGTTRSGKGEIEMLPGIDIYSRAENKTSMIINDPKGELLLYSKDLFEKRGYTVWALNLIQLLNSMGYSPLELIRNSYKRGEIGDAQTLTKAITYTLYFNAEAKDPYWQDCSMALVNGMILALCERNIKSREEKDGMTEEELLYWEGEEKKITLYTVANMLSELGGKNTLAGNALNLYFESLPSDSIAKMQYAASKFSSDKERGIIFSFTMSKLQQYTMQDVAKLTSSNDIDFEKIGFGDKPIALFMLTPDWDPSNNVLTSILVRQSYYVLAKNATLKGGKCKRRVVYHLDEWGSSMPVIENLAGILTVCLGRNIMFNLVAQSYDQVKEKYRDSEKTIKDNMGNTFYICSKGTTTSEEISELLGDETITITSRSGSILSLNKQRTESVDHRRLLTGAELRNLKEGEMVVLRGKRKDNKGNNVVPNPIFCTEKTRMLYRYEYMPDTFKNNQLLENFEIECNHKNLNLKSLIVDLSEDIERLEEEKYNQQLELEVATEQKLKAYRAKFSEKHKKSNKEVLESQLVHSKNKETPEKIPKELKERLVKITKAFLKDNALKELELVSTLEEASEYIDKYDIPKYDEMLNKMKG